MYNSFFADDTIVGVATPSGSGGVAIVRMSGRSALEIANRFVRKRSKIWQPRYMYYCEVVDTNGQLIDKVLAVSMPSPTSYTGEDVVEIHCHGGWVLPRLIVDLCVSCGARLAEPGEFTYRAFMSGKMTLTEAESVLDLIEAKSKDAVLLAADGLNGVMSEAIRRLKDDILDLIAQYEAEIDYGDEIEMSDISLLINKSETFLKEIERLIDGAHKGRNVIDGIDTVLIGPPNAGKSTLWNALIGQNKALVTPYPGTTRDILEDYVNVRGCYLHLIDTAGLHDTCDPVEKLGIEKTKESVKSARLFLLVLDGSQSIPQEFVRIFSDIVRVTLDNVLVILNKSDIKQLISKDYVRKIFGINCDVCQVSLLNMSDVEVVKDSIIKLCQTDISPDIKALSISQRQLQALNKIKESLLSLKNGAINNLTCDCLLLDLRECLVSINSLTGENVSDDIIDRVFSKFCLGK